MFLLSICSIVVIPWSAVGFVTPSYPGSRVRYYPLRHKLPSFLAAETTTTMKTSESEVEPSPSTPREDVDMDVDMDMDVEMAPQVFSTGRGIDSSLTEALRSATRNALVGLPEAGVDGNVDLVYVTVSSLYEGTESMSTVVPTVLEALGFALDENPNDTEKAGAVPKVLGCTCADRDGAVTVTLARLPGVTVETFVIDEYDDDKDAVLSGGSTTSSSLSSPLPFPVNDPENDDIDDGCYWILPSPGFQKCLDGFLTTFHQQRPHATLFGGIASTVSSLSRARLFCSSTDDIDSSTAFVQGCVGVRLSGDVSVRIRLARAAKPVGPWYRIVDGSGPTVRTVASFDYDESTNTWTVQSPRPRPPLAEANRLMKSSELSDAETRALGRTLLVGLLPSGDQTPPDLSTMRVRRVASAGRTDGSITFPLGSRYNDNEEDGKRGLVRPGAPMRFLVRDAVYGLNELDELWEYLVPTLTDDENEDKDEETTKITAESNVAACLYMSTMDRSSLFGNDESFESRRASKALPDCNAIFDLSNSNGVICAETDDDDEPSVHGSASCYILFGTKSGRPVYSRSSSTDNDEGSITLMTEEPSTASSMTEGDVAALSDSTALSSDGDTAAPRGPDGELVLRRREVHSGRAMNVGSVEWSVAETMGRPTCAFEEYLWDKETEVDRWRERVPLINLVSQCKSVLLNNPTLDWMEAAFRSVVVPELGRRDGSGNGGGGDKAKAVLDDLRRRYDPVKLASTFVEAGSEALCVNTDAIRLGGSFDELTMIKEAFSASNKQETDTDVADIDADADADAVGTEEKNEGVPILASDLVLYPYQLYGLRLAGADAVLLTAGALPTPKDLNYLIKIGRSLGLQILVSITSAVQADNVLDAGADTGNYGFDGLVVSDRCLETYGWRTDGAALELLRNHKGVRQAMQSSSLPVLAQPAPTADLTPWIEAGAKALLLGAALVPPPLTDENDVDLVLDDGDVFRRVRADLVS